MTELGTLAPTSHNDANQNSDNENTDGDWSHHRDPEGSVNVAADRNEESRRERSDSNLDAEEDTAIPGTAADASGPGSVRLEQLLFFLAGLGTSIGYISTLSSLVYFKLLFGPNSFVYLNCAVFLPLLPVSLAQAIWDSWFDVVYRTRVTFLVRGIVGYGFVLAGTLGILAFGRQAKDDDPAYYYYDYDNDNNNNNDNDSGEIDDEHHYGLRWVIFHALLQGIGGAVLYGQLNQLASFVGRSHLSHDNDNDTDNDTGDRLAKTFQATLSAGVQASALVVLAASVSSGFGTTNGSRFASFASWILAVELICFVASLWLLAARPRIQVSMLRRDASMSVLQVQMQLPAAAVPGADRDEEEEEKQEDDADDRWSSSSSSSCTELEDFHQLLGPPGSSANRTGLLLRQPLLPRRPLLRLAPQNRLRTTSSGDHSQSAELSLTELLYHSRWCCYGMVLTLVPSFLVGSWFTRVQTDWMDLAQVLFYTRIGSDLVGRFATMLVSPSSIRCVVWAAGLRWVLVVLFFVNASHKPSSNPNSAHAATIRAATTATATTQTTQEQRDALSIALVATIAFCSGYLVTACYQLAPQQLPGTPELRATNAAKQASLLTVAFSVSAIGGLVSSFVLLAIGV